MLVYYNNIGFINSPTKDLVNYNNSVIFRNPTKDLVNYNNSIVFKNQIKDLVFYSSLVNLFSSITEINAVTNLKVGLASDGKNLDLTWDYFDVVDGFKIYISKNVRNLADYILVQTVEYYTDKISYITQISKTFDYIIVVPFIGEQLGKIAYTQYQEEEVKIIKKVEPIPDRFKDIKNETFCDHLIKDEEVELVFDDNIQKYYIRTKYKHNKNKKVIKIKEYYSGQEFLNFDIDEFDRIILNDFDFDLNQIPKPIFLIDYITELGNCPKCYGTKTLKDIFPLPSGDLAFVYDENKVKNYLIKGLKTQLGSNILHTEYGSNLSSLIGQKNTPFTVALAKQIIYELIDKLKTYQNDEIDIPSEQRIYNVNKLNITFTEPRTLNIELGIVLQSGDILNLDYTQEI